MGGFRNWTLAVGEEACSALTSGRLSKPFLIELADGLGISTERAGLTLLFDGRIDNRRELARALGLETPLSDPDLLTEAWRRWDTSTLDRLVGDFVIAVYDSRRGQLTLARDIFGQKPLFFRKLGNGLLAGPSAAALAGFDGAPEPNWELLLREQFFTVEDDDLGYFRDVRRVRGGEVLTFGRSISRRFYWQPDLSPARIDLASSVEAYRELLDEAVAACLPSKGPIATHLSSGFDSSAVTATAARLDGPDRLRAFTSIPQPSSVPLPKDRIADEGPIARRLAEQLGIQHETVQGVERPLSIWRRLTGPFETPIIEAFNMGWWVRISEMARSAGAEVLLTGDVGNSTLNFGGPQLIANFLSDGRPLSWMRETILALRQPVFSWKGVAFNAVAPFIPGSVRHRLTGANHRDVCFVRRDHWSQVSPMPDFDSSAPQRLKFMRTLDWGPTRHATLKLYGVEERDPLANRRLAEFSLRLPPELFFKDGQSRPLAKQALSDRLPPYILGADRRGLQSADWALRLTRAEAGEALEEISASPASADLFDLDLMRSCLSDWPTEDWNRPDHVRRYRRSFSCALAIGYFLLSLEGRL